MKIAVNGESQILEAESVNELLESKGIDPAQAGVAVAINDRVVRRADWNDTRLIDGDRIEIITAMQGG